MDLRNDKAAHPVTRSEATFAIADLVHGLATHAVPAKDSHYDFYLLRGREILRRLNTAGWQDDERSES